MLNNLTEPSLEDWKSVDFVYNWMNRTDQSHPFSADNPLSGYKTLPEYFCDTYGYETDASHTNFMDESTGMPEYERWLDHYAAKLNLKVITVDAPNVLKAHGIETIKAYPEALLEIRCIQMPH